MKKRMLLTVLLSAAGFAGAAQAHDWDGDGWRGHHHGWRRPPAYYYGPPARVIEYDPYYAPRYYRPYYGRAYYGPPAYYRPYRDGHVSYGFSMRID